MYSPEDKLLYSIAETQRILGLGRTTVWRLVASGDLEAVRVGARRLIKADSVRRLASEGAAA